MICIIKMTLWLLFCFQEKEGERGDVKYGGWNLDIFFWTTMCFRGVTPHGFKKSALPPIFSGKHFKVNHFIFFQ